MDTDFNFELSAEVLGDPEEWIEDSIKSDGFSGVDAAKDVCEEHEVLVATLKLLISHEELSKEKVYETIDLARDIKGVQL